MNKQIQTKLCWRLLIKCHNLNQSVQKGLLSNSYSNRIYSQKEQLLEECIRRIQEYGLKIKHGYQLTESFVPYILYFEYNGMQVSFHSHTNYGIKPFNGEWIGYKQGLLKDLDNKIPARWRNVRNKTY